MFLVKGVLKICSKFTGEHSCRSVISIKFLEKYTNEDLKISLFFRLFVKQYFLNFGFLPTPQNYRVIHRCSLYFS